MKKKKKTKLHGVWTESFSYMFRKRYAKKRWIGKDRLNLIDVRTVAHTTFSLAWHGFKEEGARETGRLLSSTLARAYRSVTERVQRRRMKNHPVRRGLVDHRGSTGVEWQERPVRIEPGDRASKDADRSKDPLRRGLPVPSLFRITGAENASI